MGNYGRYIIPKTEKDFFTIYNQILAKGKHYYDMMAPCCIVHILKDYKGLHKGQKLFAFYGDKYYDDGAFMLGFCLRGPSEHRADKAFNDFINTLDAPPDIYYVAGRDGDYCYSTGDSLCIIDDSTSYEDIEFSWPSEETDFLSKYDLDMTNEKTEPYDSHKIDEALKSYGINFVPEPIVEKDPSIKIFNEPPKSEIPFSQ